MGETVFLQGRVHHRERDVVTLKESLEPVLVIHIVLLFLLALFDFLPGPGFPLLLTGFNFIYRKKKKKKGGHEKVKKKKGKRGRGISHSGTPCRSPERSEIRFSDQVHRKRTPR